MAINFPGPGIVELYYTVTGLTHKQQFSVNMAPSPTPGLLPVQYDLITRAGTTVSFADFIDDWVALLQPMYPQLDMTFDRAELWYSDQTSFDKIFLTVAFIGLPGTGSNAERIANQQTISFRTLEGGQMRIVLLESSDGIAINDRQGFPTTDAQTNAIITYVTSDACPMLGRDTSAPYSGIAVSNGENEVLFRKRYR